MAGLNNTAWSPDSDLTAQITGSGKATPGYNGPASIGAGFTPVYAATIELSPFLMKSRFVQIVTTAGLDSTLTTLFVAAAGAILNIQINNPTGGSRIITFGTGFRPTGTVTDTAAHIFLVQFVSDGLTWNEVARSAAAVA